LVLDCTDSKRAWACGLGAWRRFRLSENAEAFENSDKTNAQAWSRFEGRSAAVRLEDQLSVYELSAGRLLCQAALGAKRHFLGRKSLRLTRPWELGQAGIFLGGLCEASILLHAEDLRLKMALDGRPADRVGCVVMPITNYRHLGGTRIQPETIHSSAIESAFTIAMDAAFLHRFYTYPQKSVSGFRGQAAASRFFDPAPADRESLVGVWVDRLSEASDRQAVLTDWCQSEGARLASDAAAQTGEGTR